MWAQENKDDGFDNAILSALYKWKHTGNSAVRKKEKCLNQNLGLFTSVFTHSYFVRSEHPLKVDV